MNALIEPHYFPCLEYFCAIASSPAVVLEKFEHFPKQTLRNRCYINTSDGVRRLTVPLEEKSGKVLTKDIRVEQGLRWRNVHWRTIQSAYAKAPFFEHYTGEVHRIIFTDSPFLFDLDLACLSFCLRSIRWKTEVSATDCYQEFPPGDISDLRSQISDKTPESNRKFYRTKPYYQVFGSSFASNLSLLDALFCVGPDAPEILRASGKEKLNK